MEIKKGKVITTEIITKERNLTDLDKSELIEIIENITQAVPSKETPPYCICPLNTPSHEYTSVYNGMKHYMQICRRCGKQRVFSTCVPVSSFRPFN